MKVKTDAIVLRHPANVRAATGIDCDNAWVVEDASGTCLYTDFRYIPMAHRVAPDLKVRDIRKASVKGRRIGYESTLTMAEFAALKRFAPRGARFIDRTREILARRAVKRPEEIAKLRAAVALNDRIWQAASRRFKAGMTEKAMARVIRGLMLELGDGEAFDTIVCVGANAAECHHVPDGTVWNGREPVLVDMGVKLDGYCSDMTRCLRPVRPRGLYAKVYDLVLAANRAAIAAARPGMTGKALDKVARDIIRKGGFGRCFGHALGHGVGLEIHEAPTASKSSDWVLEPGMLVTIEPGVYLEGNLGVRIEDLVLITETGCEVLSVSEK